KTRLAQALADGSGALVLCGRAVHGAAAPYGPIVAALRSYVRGQPGGLDDTGPLRPHLALLLPELGDPAPSSDRATLCEAVGGAAPVPETVRDAVLMSTSELSPAGRAAAEAAAVAGVAFGLEVVGGVASAAGLQELVERELIAEDGVGRGAFRHGLARDALY